jgi:phage FluMu protein Com
MRSIDVVLEFACCSCGHHVSAKLRCSGKGLAAGPHTVAAVKIPCPTCDNVNELYFEPCGTLHAVFPYRSPCETLGPSAN